MAGLTPHGKLTGHGKPGTPYTKDALARRFYKTVPSSGPNGPSGGKKQLAPSNGASAGSMFKPNKKAGKLTRALHNLPLP